MSRAHARPAGSPFLGRPGYTQRLRRIDRRFRLWRKDADLAVDTVEVDLPLAKERQVFGHEVRGDVNRPRAADGEVDGLEEVYQVFIRPGRLQGIDHACTPKGEVQGSTDRCCGS